MADPLADAVFAGVDATGGAIASVGSVATGTPDFEVRNPLTGEWELGEWARGLSQEERDAVLANPDGTVFTQGWDGRWKPMSSATWFDSWFPRYGLMAIVFAVVVLLVLMGA